MIGTLAGRRMRAGLVLCVPCVAVSCSGSPPADMEETLGEAGGESLAAAVDARYLTHLLFAADDGTAFAGSFDQTAEGSDLRLDYQVRLADGHAWRPLILAQDTVAVARAAWRLIPTRGMAVRIGDAGQVISLLFAGSAGESPDSVRLVAGEEVSVWTGPTGQRESLGIAALQTGGRAVAGILFFRRAARALSLPATPTHGQTFVFADSLGNGLVVHAGTDGQPPVAHTWLHGVDAAWGDVTLEAPEPGRPGSISTWRFAISGTTVRGSFRPVASEDPGSDSGQDPGPGALVRMEAVVFVGAEELLFKGFSAILSAP